MIQIAIIIDIRRNLIVLHKVFKDSKSRTIRLISTASSKFIKT